MRYLLPLFLLLSFPAYAVVTKAAERCYLTDIVLDNFTTQPGRDDPTVKDPAPPGSLSGWFVIDKHKLVDWNLTLIAGEEVLYDPDQNFGSLRNTNSSRFRYWRRI